MKVKSGGKGELHHAAIDWLRFSAAFLVVLFHARGFIFVKYGALDEGNANFATAVFFLLTRLGQESVIVFFALSGYLVGGKVLDRVGNGTFDPSAYAIDRITRVFVPLLPALIFTAFVAGGVDGVWIWCANLIGLQGILAPTTNWNLPLWSLAYEIWFYVLAFAIGRQALCHTVDILSLCLLCLVFVVFCHLKVEYLVIWVIGAVFYAKSIMLFIRKPLLIALVLGILSVGASQLLSSEYKVFFPNGFPSSAGTVISEIMIAVSTGMACAAFNNSNPQHVSATPAPMAAFSYTLYLTHYPLMLQIEKFRGEPMTTINGWTLSVFAVYVFTVILGSWVFYWFFERNTWRARKALKRAFGVS
jgi:peptidoglycan/LPS O-acetylase OafA/YrhL